MTVSQVSGGVLGVGFALEKLVSGLPRWVPLALYLSAYGLGGFFTVREAIYVYWNGAGAKADQAPR